MVIVSALIASIGLLWAYVLWSRRRYYALAWKLPGPLGLPLIGILHQIFNMADLLYVVLGYTIKYRAKTILSWLGPWPIVYTIDPKIAKVFLNSPNCIDKSVIYDVLNDMLGDGLLTSKHPIWNKHRKLLNPSFRHNVLLELFPIFNATARRLCDQFDANIDCGEVNLKALIFDATMRSSIATTVGLNTEGEESKAILHSFEKLLVMTINRALNPWLRNAAIFRRTKTYKSLVECRTLITTFLEALILKKIKALQETEAKKVQAVPEIDIKKPKHILIDQAIDIYRKNQFTFEDIMSEGNLMLFASYETTATTLFSTLMCLAMHPQYQDRVYDEILTAFPDKDFDVNYEDFKNLVYLDMCINETLRVITTVPVIARVCTNDVAISDDIVIPKGTQILVDIFNIHRDKDIWGPAADTYNPDNFLPSNLMDKHKYSFIPFSKGPRNCIGWLYAGMFLKVTLVKILRRYKFSTKFKFEDLRFVEHLTLKFVESPHLEIHRR